MSDSTKRKCTRWMSGACGDCWGCLGPEIESVRAKNVDLTKAVDNLTRRLGEAERERDRLALEVVDLNAKLTASMAEKKPGEGYIGCRHCPFWKHVHYEEGGKLVAPCCSGFEPEGA